MKPQHALFTVCLALAPVAAAVPDEPQVRLSWQLGFGVRHAAEYGYGLSGGYDSADHDDPSATLVQLQVTGADASARIAGLPLLERNYRTAQAADSTAKLVESPWYSRQWAWWTAGGIAAVAALAGGGGGGSEGHTLQVQDRGSSPTTINGDMEGGYEVCSTGSNTCASVPGQGFIASSRGDPSSPEDLYGETGGMGDLLPRSEAR